MAYRLLLAFSLLGRRSFLLRLPALLRSTVHEIAPQYYGNNGGRHQLRLRILRAVHDRRARGAGVKDLHSSLVPLVKDARYVGCQSML